MVFVFCLISFDPMTTWCGRSRAALASLSDLTHVVSRLLRKLCAAAAAAGDCPQRRGLGQGSRMAAAAAKWAFCWEMGWGMAAETTTQYFVTVSGRAGIIIRYHVRCPISSSSIAFWRRRLNTSLRQLVWCSAGFGLKVFARN